MEDKKNVRYVPVLKGKLGEFKAINLLSDEVKDKIEPLIEIPPIPWDFEVDAPDKTIDQHLEKFIPNVEKYWETGRNAYVDFNFLPSDENMADGEHPVKRIFEEARQKGLSLIPVVGLGRTDEYIDSVTNVNKIDKRGACLRIESIDIEDDSLEETIVLLLEKLEVSERDVDIIIDLKVIQKDQIGLLARSVRDVIRSLPNIEEWRSLTLVSTAFPQTMSGFESNAISLVSRVEWQLWTNLLHNLSKIERMPDYGDYTVVHPELLDIDPRVMQLGAKVKYTFDNDWIIVKGVSIRRGGSEQTRGLCQKIISMNEYQGADFSYGDKYIKDCAEGNQGTGNQTTWVTVGVNHHISFVVNQLANNYVS